MLRVAACHLLRRWEALKVELHGSYSFERMLHLKNFSVSTSIVGAIARAAITPIPSIAMVILLDLLPLEPPNKEIECSMMIWVRFALSWLIQAFALTEQCRHFVTELPASSSQMFGVSVASTAATMAGLVCLVPVLGFPVPFVATLTAPFGCTAIGFAMYALWHTHIRQSATTRAQLRQFGGIVTTQVTAVYVYQSYAYVFRLLSGPSQAAFAMLLPVLKIAGKNALSRFVTDAEDDKAEFITFHVEVFHSIFVATCLQTSVSVASTLAFALFDIGDMWLSLRDLRLLLHSVDKCLDEPARAAEDPTRSKTATHTKSGVTRCKMHYLDAVVFLLDNDQRRVLLSMSESGRLDFAQRVLQALYLSEILVLVEFVEVVIPCIYSVFTLAAFNLSNRDFYTQFQGMDDNDVNRAVANVMLYVGFEVVSLIYLSVTVQRKLRISALHQLAFVLERQWQEVQSKLLLWILMNLQSLLVHYGADFSFKFAWLHDDGAAVAAAAEPSAP